jgi:hypothetical protein
MLCAYAISSTAPPGSQKSSRLTHGIYVVSVCGWKVVIAAERVAGSRRSRSTTQATWSRPECS